MSKPSTLLAPVASCAVVLLCAACAAPVAAQTQPAQRPDTPPAATASQTPAPAAANAATGEPDLSITANVTARELVFEVVPTPKVEFPGRPRRDTVWEAERTNLPPQVQPGVTYRDIGIRLRITSVFADIERIVAEALGEIPARDDDAAPKTDSNENAQPPAAAVPPPTNEATQPAAASPTISQTSPASSAQAGRPRVPSGRTNARRGRT